MSKYKEPDVYTNVRGYTKKLEPTIDAFINDNAPLSSKEFVWSIQKFAKTFSLVGHNHNDLYPKIANFNLLKKDVGLIGEDIINLTKLVNEIIEGMLVVNRTKIDDIEFSNNKLKIIANGIVLKEVPININIDINNIAKVIIDDEASNATVNKTWSVFKLVNSFAPFVHVHDQYVTHEYLESIKPTLKGERGEKGLTGRDGKIGETGKRGLQGIPGINGRSMILKGHLNSIDELPTVDNLVGDTFIVGTNIFSYNGALWINGGNLQGPQGINGINGINGKNGINGVDGRDGLPYDDFGFVTNVPPLKKGLKLWALVSEDSNPKVPELIEFLDYHINTYFCEKYNFYNNRFVLKNTNISTEIPMINVYTVVNNEWVLSRTVSTFQSYVFIRSIASNVNIKLSNSDKFPIKVDTYPNKNIPRYLQQKRGYSNNLSNYLGNEGEILVDLDRKSARVFDGEQVGGYELAKQRDVGNINDTTLAPELKGKTLIGMIKYLFKNGGSGGDGPNPPTPPPEGGGNFIKDWGIIGDPDSVTVQIKRGTTAQISNVILPEAELVYDTTKKTIYIGDDVTPGGTSLATKSNLNELNSQISETTRKIEENNIKINKVSGDLETTKIEINGTINSTKDEITKKMASIETSIDGITTTVGSHSNTLTTLDSKVNIVKNELTTDINNAKQTAISESQSYTNSFTEQRVSEAVAQIKVTTDSISQKVQGNETLIQNANASIEKSKQELTTKINESKDQGFLDAKDYINAEIKKTNQQTSEKLAEITTNLDGINLKVASNTESISNADIKINQTKNDLLVNIDEAKTSTLRESKDFTQTHTQKKVSEAVAAIKITTDSITQRVEGSEKSITETNTSLNQAKEQINSKLTDLDNKVSNITIGGGNLISNKKYKILSFNTNIVIGTMDNIAIRDSRVGPIETEKITLKDAGLKKGVEYTLSFTQTLDISEDNNPKGTYLVFYKENTQSYIGIFGGESTVNLKEYIVKTFTTPMEATHVAIRLLSSQTATSVIRKKGTIEGLKLEEGNQATSWSPAPDDIVSDIDNAKKEAIKASKEYTNIEVNKTVQASEQKFSEIQTTLDNISLKVNSNTEAVTSVDSKLDHAKQELDKNILNAKNQAIEVSQSFTEEKVREAKAAIDITTDSISQKVTANEKSIVTTNTSLEANKQELQGNIDNSILTTKEYAKTEVDKIVTSTNEKFGEITTKLGQIDLAVGNVNETVTSVNAKVDANKEEVDGKIAGIDIGVVNKIKNSDFSFNKNGWDKLNTTILDDAGLKYITLGYEWNAMQTMKFEADKDYTFSSLLRYSNSNVNFNKARVLIRMEDDIQGTEVNGLISLVDIPQDKWIRLHTTIKAKKTGIHQVYFLKEHNNADNKLDFAKLKLELGNKPTEWSPSPYDTETGIQNAKSEAISVSQNFTQTKVEEAKAAIKLTTDGITQRVTSTEKSVTETNTKIDVTKNELQTNIGQAKEDAINESNKKITIEINKVVNSNNEKFAEIQTTIDGINTNVSRLTNETITINGEIVGVKKALEVVEQKVTPEGIYTEIKKNGQFNNEVINEIAAINQTSEQITSQLNKIESITGEECVANGNFKENAYKWYRHGGINYTISSASGKKWLNISGTADNRDKSVYQDCFIKDGISYDFSASIYGSARYYKVILQGRVSTTGVYEDIKSFGTITNSFSSDKPQQLEYKNILNTKYDLVRIKITAPTDQNFNYFITDISFSEKGKLASQTEITMLQDQISQKVNVDGVSSVIEQNPNSVQIGFNKINNSFEVNPTGVFLKDTNGQNHLDFTKGAMHTYNPETGQKIGSIGMAEWTESNKPSLKYGLSIIQNKNSWFGITEYDDETGVSKPSMSFNFSTIGSYKGIYVYDNFMFKNNSSINDANIFWSEGLRDSVGIYCKKNDPQGASSTIRLSCGTSPKDAIWIGCEGYQLETIGKFSPSGINFHKALNMNNNSIVNSRMIQSETFKSVSYNFRKRTEVKTNLTKTITPNTEYIGEAIVKNNICEVLIPEELIGLGIKYMVILTPVGNKNIYLSEKLEDKFVIKGEDCNFDYCMKIINQK